MPLPKPRQGENRAEFISRCMGNENVQNEASNNDQALAICHGLWEERGMNDSLLKAIQSRTRKLTEFGYGILTADKYVKTMQDFVGMDLCYRLASNRNQSYTDVLSKASQTLVYGNRDMVVEDVYDQIDSVKQSLPEDVEFPKNTLMVFRHVLTTPRKDRDGDILRTEGAAVDPALPLLWQHVHTLPIGKMLFIHEHTPKKLTLVTAIIDINELAHDAAVMVDNKMGRFSHGFRALEFHQLKEDTDEHGPPGFEITKFEIMEESIVSVPSNVDAEEEEVMLSLVESGKLKSSVMREYGEVLRAKRPVAVMVPNMPTWTVTYSLSTGDGQAGKIDSKGVEDEDKPTDRGKEEGSGEGIPSEEAEAVSEKEPETASHEEMKVEEKAGRSLSAKNLKILKNVKSDLEEMMEKENLSRGGNAMCERCVKALGDVIQSASGDEEEDKSTEPAMSVKEAIALFIAEASDEERNIMSRYLEVLGRSREQERRTRAFRALLGV